MATSILTTTTMATTISTQHHHLDNPTPTTTITVKGEDTLLHHQHYHHGDNINENKYNSRYSFLSLPAEVRNEIYSHLFTDLRLGVSTKSHGMGPFRSSASSCCPSSFPWGIRNTCRRIREEVTPLMLGATTLEVTCRGEKSVVVKNGNSERGGRRGNGEGTGGGGEDKGMVVLPDGFLRWIPRVVVFDAKVLSAVGGSASSASSGVGRTLGSGEIDYRSGDGGGFQLGKFQALRVLEVRNISVWCQYYEESYLETAEADECMFNLAMFNLGRIGPGLIKLCEDPTRGFRILLWCQFVGNSMRHETVEAVIDVDTRTILQKSKGETVRSRNAWAGFY